MFDLSENCWHTVTSLASLTITNLIRGILNEVIHMTQTQPELFLWNILLVQ